MKVYQSPIRLKQGFTLLEMTIVIMILLALVKLGLFSSKKMSEWQLGRAASETLRTVYAAQRMYLADNPTKQPAALVPTDILPYMAGNSNGTMTSLPTVKSLTGTQLSIIVTTSPPTINAGNGVSYDPSGSTKDTLWDTGE
jgi:prepilin-type N-terminal cleavage/methylation domain-containing protein